MKRYYTQTILPLALPIVAVFTLISLFYGCACAHAQELLNPAPVHAVNQLPNAPQAQTQAKPKPKPHKFFDRQNTAAFSASALTLAADGYTTRERLGPGLRERNPLARQFTRTDAGTAAYFAGSLGAEIGLTYLCHRTGHHRIERIVPWVVSAVEVGAVMRSRASH